MDYNQIRKVSLFLPENVHLGLKREAVDKRTSLQKLITQRIASAEGAPAPREEELESLRLAPHEIDRRTVEQWKRRLQTILESGNRLAILNCTSTIEAMEALIRSASQPLTHNNTDTEKMM